MRKDWKIRTKEYAEYLMRKWKKELEFDNSFSEGKCRHHKGMWKRLIREELENKDLPVAVFRQAALAFIEYRDYSRTDWYKENSTRRLRKVK